MNLVALAALAALAPAPQPPVTQDVAQDVARHLPAAARARIDASLERATRWLALQQDADGSFSAEALGAVPTLPRTAMALWALCRAGAAREPAAEAAARYLLSFQQSDGSVHDPGRGLERFSAAIAHQALSRWVAARPQVDAPLAKRLERLAASLERGHGLESFDEELPVPLATPGPELDALEGEPELSEGMRRAVEFLRRSRDADGAAPPPLAAGDLAYDDLLASIAAVASAGDPAFGRVQQALRARYTLAHNPGLASRAGAGRARRGDAGLYYYYLLVARTLHAFGEPLFTTDDGERHDWAAELADRLLAQQEERGAWVNANPRWGEGDPVLTTAYAVLALDLCRRQKP